MANTATKQVSMEVAEPMTDYQMKLIIKMIRQTVAAKVAAGQTPQDILAAIDELLDSAAGEKQAKADKAD
jgi:hypothetical protein